MTTKRKQILKAIALAGSATINDLELATGLTRRNLQDNLKATVDAGLIERQRDDVTGLPAYKLSKAGRIWLEKDKDDSSNKPATKISSVTPAGGGDISPAARASDHLPVNALPDEGAAVTEPPTLDKMPAAARSGEKLTALDIAARNHNLLMEIVEAVELPQGARMDSIPEVIRARLAELQDAAAPLSEFRRLDIDLAWQIANLENEARRKQETIDSMANAAIKFCGITAELTGGDKYPLNLYECQLLLADCLTYMERKISSLQVALEAAQTVIANIEPEEDLIAEIGRLRAENKVLKILDETMPGFGAAHEALKNARYLVADSYIIIDNRHEAQRAALQIALDSGTTTLLASINGAEQVAINPVWEAA